MADNFLYDGTKESESAINKERKELEAEFVTAIGKLKKQMEVCANIADKLEQNGCRWVGKTEDDDFRRCQSLKRSDDMLTDIREWYY